MRLRASRLRSMLTAASSLAPNWPGQCRGAAGPASCSPRCLSESWPSSRAACTSHGASPGLTLQPCLQSRQPHMGICTRAPVGQAASVAVAAVEEDEVELCPGRMIEFKRDTKTGLALIDRPDGKRNWIIVDGRGLEFSVRPSQVSYVLPGYHKAVALQQLEEQAQGMLDPELLPMAWEMSEKGDLYSVAQMAMQLFGSNADAAELYAAHQLLQTDRTHFKQAARIPVPLFQPRPASEVEMLLARAAAEAKAAEELAAVVKTMRTARSYVQDMKPSADIWRTGPWSSYVSALEAFAFIEASQKQQTSSQNVLSALGTDPTSAAAAHLLRQIGAWGPHDQGPMLQARLTNKFPRKLEDEAQSIILSPRPDPDADNRRDLSHLSVVTIDDASTTEVDDGLSVEHRGEGLPPRLWVHIADPTRWLLPKSPLELEARRRSKSLYLPTGAIFMFPSSIATGPFSLRLGHACCALSIGMVLNPDGSLAETVITPSTVKITNRMTYHDVNATLEDEASLSQHPDLQVLNEAAKLRERWRSSQGAVMFTLEGTYIQVKDAHLSHPSITLKPDQPATPANSLVAEMMIAAGEAAGSLGHKEGLPLPYRGQAEAVLPSEEELAKVPEGVCREVMIRSRMTRSVTTISDPQPHASLGLPAYVQISSPIRRYTDLLAHWQIKAHLRGQSPPMSIQALALVVDEANEQGREWMALERKARDYWTALYFQQQTHAQPHKLWPAILLQWHHQEKALAKVLLHELGLETVARVDKPAVAGDALQLRCTRLDVPEGIFKFTDVTHLETLGTNAGAEVEDEQEEGLDGSVEAADADISEGPKHR